MYDDQIEKRKQTKRITPHKAIATISPPKIPEINGNIKSVVLTSTTVAHFVR
jgi:hypothetical protein